jgi:hypothetical protein
MREKGRPDMDDVKEKVINDLLEALKVRHGDAVMSDEPGVALIPYFSHGRMQAHEIDLDDFAQTAISRLIMEGKIPAEKIV